MRSRTVRGAVASYAGTLGERNAATARAYRWALEDLAATLGDDDLHDVLGGQALGLWLTSPTAAGREPSAASTRQRATAARGLLRHALEAGTIDEATAATALATLRRPATPPVVREAAPARLVLARAAGGRPHGVSWHVWVRFRAHTMLLAETGAPERELGRAAVADLADDAGVLAVAGRPHRLTDPTRHAVAAWLDAREDLVRTLQGSPPAQLWVRAHPSVHPRTGAVAAVGMPITARGLRKAFQDVVAALAGEDPRVLGCTVAHVRALAGPAEGADGPGPTAAGGRPSIG